MFHSLALTNALAALAAFAPLVQAEAQPCPGLAIESVVYGTQRVPRDPRDQGSEMLTLSVVISNQTAGALRFGLSFSSPAVQQDFVSGQSWTLQGGGQTTIMVANVLRPGLSVGAVRAGLRFTFA